MAPTSGVRDVELVSTHTVVTAQGACCRLQIKTRYTETQVAVKLSARHMVPAEEQALGFFSRAKNMILLLFPSLAKLDFKSHSRSKISLISSLQQYYIKLQQQTMHFAQFTIQLF